MIFWSVKGRELTMTDLSETGLSPMLDLTRVENAPGYNLFLPASLLRSGASV